MKSQERFAWRDHAKVQAIQPYILERVLKLFEPMDDLLGVHEHQERYISTRHLAPMECPFCDQSCSYFEAVQDDDYRIGYDAKVLRCKHCGNELSDIVPFMGPMRWQKKSKAAHGHSATPTSMGTAGASIDDGE